MSPLSKAAVAAGIDLNSTMEGLLSENTTVCGEQRLRLSDYFILLHRLTRLTNDEALAMSERPLMRGACHYVLQQAASTNTFEELLHHFAKSFNLLHGGTINHVLLRDDKIIYAIDNESFPYPFDVTFQENNALMDCVVILVHCLLSLCVDRKLDDALREVRTRSRFPKSQTPPFQLAFWNTRVVPGGNSYSLAYDIGAGDFKVDLDLDSLPSEDAIYLEVARIVKARHDNSQQLPTFIEKVQKYIQARSCCEEDIARGMHVSVRTLRRRLTAAGTSFKALRQETMNRLAKRMLRQNYLVEEVAEKLGYSDPRSFRRAFIKWNDLTPKAYKSQHSELGG